MEFKFVTERNKRFKYILFLIFAIPCYMLAYLGAISYLLTNSLFVVGWLLILFYENNSTLRFKILGNVEIVTSCIKVQPLNGQELDIRLENRNKIYIYDEVIVYRYFSKMTLKKIEVFENENKIFSCSILIDSNGQGYIDSLIAIWLEDGMLLGENKSEYDLQKN